MRLKRTHNCGQLRKSDCGSEIIVAGWVDTYRDHGGLIFIDLRDRYGLTQIVFNPEEDADLHAQAEKLRPEDVIAVKGWVKDRPEGTVNSKLPTGEIEVRTIDLEILNKSKTPPFSVSGDEDISSEIRLKHRYVDLRRPAMQENFILRHRALKAIRDFLSSEGFIDIETPVLTKSTPEGARDYLVPSRMYPGKFYALPQSPQMFKQILMCAGFDKYAQIVKCFRDEDLRAERQPEFTQLDLEMSFVDEDDILLLIERLMEAVFRDVIGSEILPPFPRMTYAEAMLRYGCDKPDIRFGMEIYDVTEALRGTKFKVFSSTVERGGIIRGIRVEGKAGDFSRKDLDTLIDFAKEQGAGGLVWMKVKEAGVDSPIAKFLSDKEISAIITQAGAKEGDILLLAADNEDIVCTVLSALRLKLGNELGLIPDGEYRFLWIVNFPLVAYNENEKRYDAIHHPFTSPREEFLEDFDKNPDKALSQAYDLVLNGMELGSGSIRIHDSGVQRRIFNLLQLDEKEAEERFGFLLRALSYGAPPHGGIALGMDRLLMILVGTDTIRDVVAFPKTQRAVCPLTDAPSDIDPDQLKELGLKTR